MLNIEMFREIDWEIDENFNASMKIINKWLSFFILVDFHYSISDYDTISDKMNDLRLFGKRKFSSDLFSHENIFTVLKASQGFCITWIYYK